MTDFDVTDAGWLPRRGDYGVDYAAELIPLVEATTCHLGCVRAGDQATRDEFGPGGNCELLARLCAPERVAEIVPRADGPHCTGRICPHRGRRAALSSARGPLVACLDCDVTAFEVPGLGTGALDRLTDDVAVQDFSEPRYHDVLWWHVCGDLGWVPTGLGAHAVTGSVGRGDLTVRGSVLCRSCGRHGFVEGLAWRDA